MDLFAIKREEIDAYMANNSLKYPPVLPPKPPSAGSGPPGLPSGVPRKPLPSAGGSEVALPEPEPESEEDDD